MSVKQNKLLLLKQNITNFHNASQGMDKMKPTPNDDKLKITNISMHELSRNWKHIEYQNTLRKVSDTGPSFSEAANSCFTFSKPLIMACISSAKDFNCIYTRKLIILSKNSRGFDIYPTDKRINTNLRASFQANKILMKV